MGIGSHDTSSEREELDVNLRLPGAADGTMRKQVHSHEKQLGLTKGHHFKYTPCNVDCEQSLFSLKIHGKERKTGKRASVTVSVTWERPCREPLVAWALGDE